MTAGNSARWRRPKRLCAGDRIAVVAPASPFRREEFEAGIAEIAALGFEPVYDERVFARERFVAGPAAVRAEALHDAWRDPTIRALIAVRGGYGSAEILPLLDPQLLRADPKIFVGYSDVTALLWFHLQHGVVAFHGPMLERRLAAGSSGYHADSLLRVLGRAEAAGPLYAPGVTALREGDVRGPLLGGTLTQLTASLGTPWAFDPPQGCILFVEDVGERPYRIRRMLTQLSQAGILARAVGLVFGEMPSCDEPGGEHTIRDVVAEVVREFSGPVLFGFPSGHTTGPAWTLPFGVLARVSTTPPALNIEEAAVEA